MAARARPAPATASAPASLATALASSRGSRRPYESPLAPLFRSYLCVPQYQQLAEVGGAGGGCGPRDCVGAMLYHADDEVVDPHQVLCVADVLGGCKDAQCRLKHLR